MIKESFYLVIFRSHSIDEWSRWIQSQNFRNYLIKILHAVNSLISHPLRFQRFNNFVSCSFLNVWMLSEFAEGKGYRCHTGLATSNEEYS